MRSNVVSRGVCLIFALAAGCGGDAKPPNMPDSGASPDGMPDGPQMTSMMIDEAGGTVTLGGDDVRVEIPPGSVDGDTMITISVSTDPAPAGALGPVYEFGPDGIVFAHPVTISLALPSGLAAADIYWSKAGGAAGYDNVGGTIEGDKVTTQVVHFSEGYVGAAQTTRTVTGSQKVSWVSASDFKLVGVDLTAFPVAALVEDGTGGYTTITGAGNSDGTFSIEGVPDGMYWLRVPAQGGGVAYYRTSANAVDAGYTAQGRPDVQPLTMPTSMQLDLTNLAAWQDGDKLEAFSTEANSWYFEAQSQATAGLPAPGDTSLTGFTFDLAFSYAGATYVMDATKTPPDRFVFAQLSHRATTSNVPYVAMTRIFEPTPFSTTNGQPTTLSGAFQDVTTGQTIALDIRADEIRASLTEENRPCTIPQSWTYGWGVYVLGVPGGLEHGVTGATADFMLIDLPRTSGNVAGTDFSFGTPLQGTWGTYGDARFSAPCELLPPGATSPVTDFREAIGLYVAEPLATFGGGPLTVRLSQVRTPTIDGMGLYVENTGLPLTPTLAWAAPTIGTPSFYTVKVSRLYADGGGAGVREPVAAFTTDQTSFKVPAGVLTAGQTYVFTIIARKSSRPDASAFNREVLPEYSATVLSAMQHF